MKLLSVDIENFMALEKAQIALADRGLVSIEGVNNDDTSAISNGAGKSSIADAVSWCLYGSTARGEDGDEVVNTSAGKGCMVKVDIIDGSDSYSIRRHRKHKTGKNSLAVWHVKSPTESFNLTKGTDKLTQEVVTRIMGCSLEVFWGAIYAGQERMPDIPGMTDKQLKVLIEEASGTTLLEEAYGEASKRALAAKSTLLTAEGSYIRADSALTDANTRLDQIHVDRDSFEDDRLARIRTIHADATTTKTAIVTLTADLAKLPKSADLLAQIRALDAKVAAVETEKTLDRKNTAAFDVASRAYASAGAQVGSANRDLMSAQSRLHNVDHKVGCPCDECGRPYTAAEVAPAKKLAAAEIIKAETAKADAQALADAALLRFTSAADARDAYQATMTDLSETIKQRTSLDATMRQITMLQSAGVGHKSDLENCIRSIKAKRDEVNPFIAQQERGKALIVDRIADLGIAGAAQTNAIIAMKVAELTAKVFSPSGVRAFLLDEVTPFLNDQTAKYLGTLSDGNITATWTTLVKNAKGELREKFSVEVATVSAGNTFKSISGGEKRKVRIACALALQDLVARRASKPIELFIGDEIDDALDDAGRERLMTVLEEKAKERGSVFVISHSDLKSWIRNTMTVTKTGEKATIMESAL